MTAYYNEFDEHAAEWLENSIRAGLIAPGVVDRRSIKEVSADELKEFTQCHFFAGIGGWSFALRRAGWPDERPVWTGSCPCQPFSTNGRKKGFQDERHLWPSWGNLIAKRRPSAVFGEQVASEPEWLRLVRSDLGEMGYAVAAIPIEAACAGADHWRERYWFVASDASRGVDFAGGAQCDVRYMENGNSETYEWVETVDGRKFRNKPGLSYLADGVSRRSLKLRAFGNAIDLRPASIFIRSFMETQGLYP